jgi:hypothetical protein
MAASKDIGGGVFLSTLKQKNDERRRQSQVSLTARQSNATLISEDNDSVSSSMKKKTSSFFTRSFLSSSSSFSKGTKKNITTTLTQHATTTNIIATTTEVMQQSDSKNSGEEKISQIETKTELALIQTGQVSRSQEIIQEQQVTSPLIDHHEKEAKHRVDKQTANELTETIFREATSNGSVSHARPRRASTTIEARRSVSMVEQLEGRERTPSIATMDSVYKHTGRDARNFEMTNPLLNTDNSTANKKEIHITHSAAEVDADRVRRTSLYNSAPHVDQAILLERRNTRTGRSPSIDGHHIARQSASNASAIEKPDETNTLTEEETVQ